MFSRNDKEIEKELKEKNKEYEEEIKYLNKRYENQEKFISNLEEKLRTMKEENEELRKEKKEIKRQSDNDIGSDFLTLENILKIITDRMDYHEARIEEARRVGSHNFIDMHYAALEEARDIYISIDSARNGKWHAKQLSKLVTNDIDRVVKNNVFTQEFSVR